MKIWRFENDRKLVNKIYAITRKEDFAKDFGLKDQIRRSSVSVMNDISEEFEGRTVTRCIEYLGVFKGSCGETRWMLYVALYCNYIDGKKFDDLYDITLTISRKLHKFLAYVENYKSNDHVKEAVVKYQT
ncbi:MAG: four helix bundle protein [Balneolaceae bacterium]|nr:four helix bundle protein [Balneolaceae bacterium]